MILRKLKIKDAKYMLEWMHDERVTKNMYTNFAAMKLDNAKNFIRNSANDKNNIHFAIASDEDEYMGTVSLKHIDYEDKSAEFAITIRYKAMRGGYSWFGMDETLKYAFYSLNLENVYWCVSNENERALAFYKKHGFTVVDYVASNILDRYDSGVDLVWFSVFKEGFLKNRENRIKSIVGCKIIDINTVLTANTGQLSFFEANKDFDFGIKRIYYITKVPEGKRRGGHAHKKLKQVLFCLSGKIQIKLDDGKEKKEYVLDNPYEAIVIDKPVWREMVWLQKDSVLCVAASEHYDEKDYIRDYEEFLLYINTN